MIATIGLSFIIFGWVYQLVAQIVKKCRLIQTQFVLCYMIGVSLLVVDGFMNGLTVLAFFNLASLLCALAVFVLLIKPRP